MIEEGDGTFERRLSAGRCPRCDTVLTDEGDVKFAAVKRKICGTCHMTIVDNKGSSDTILYSRGESGDDLMYETKLKPSEQDIADDDKNSKKMLWSDAVQIVEEAVIRSTNSKLVMEAWRRVLQG